MWPPSRRERARWGFTCASGGLRLRWRCRRHRHAPFSRRNSFNSVRPLVRLSFRPCVVQFIRFGFHFLRLRFESVCFRRESHSERSSAVLPRSYRAVSRFGFFFASLSLSLSLSLFPVISEPAVVAGRGQWSRANNNNMWKLRAATATAGDRSRAGRHRFHRSSCFFFSTGGWRTNAEMKEPTPRRLFPRWILMRSAGLEGEEATASPAPTTQKKLKVNNKGISWNVSQRCGSEKVAGPPVYLAREFRRPVM